ncbi:hypothetical protein [Hymenobacter arizonensis]|uniref:Uncharacterized protein n=1 Tax=Hymenobacter arizonensis TaxID=1227077 RepID=A0A1I6ASZ7_HYMAR|nr:hypothetical protein [Hymenobacter arizonensis]SFQ71782.1 hypothetical protein SAMN04515668_3864 [Hymenobacter arizonensis]
MNPTAEQHILADAILRHRPYPLATALRRALFAWGESVPDEEEELLWDYADSILIDMVWQGYRYVSRDEVPLLCIGPLEVFADEATGTLLTRCAVWYGADAWQEWTRQGGR